MVNLWRQIHLLHFSFRRGFPPRRMDPSSCNVFPDILIDKALALLIELSLCSQVNIFAFSLTCKLIVQLTNNEQPAEDLKYV